MLKLLRRKLGRNVAEGGFELCAEAVDDHDDRDRDASGDEAVFNGGRPGLASAMNWRNFAIMKGSIRIEYEDFLKMTCDKKEAPARAMAGASMFCPGLRHNPAVGAHVRAFSFWISCWSS